jgi:AraC-like DNA-binding protein
MPIKGMTLPWVAHHDTSLCFYLGDKPIQRPNSHANNLDGYSNKITLYGLLTQCIGEMTFEGSYNTFLIEFKPNGFTRLFDIPATEICDNAFSADSVIGSVVDKFYSQLINAANIQEKIGFADEFLFGFLKKRRGVYYNDGITRISEHLLSNSLPNITQYAVQANMSLRNFERRFSEQVGTSPKLFCRLLRFSAAVQTKVACPEKSWIDIAYDCGYYDDMHLIKEFKQFSTESPVAFFENNPFLMAESFRIVQRSAI